MGVVILADGTVVRDDDPRAIRARARRERPGWRSHAVVLAVLCAGVAMFWERKPPYADGAIPAAARAPREHRDYLYKSPFLLRDLSRASKNRAKSTFVEALKTVFVGRDKVRDEKGRELDYGGSDGADYEQMESGMDSYSMDQMYVTGTRCSSTAFALSVYFCGADAANNADAGGVGMIPSTVQLAAFLNSTREEGRPFIAQVSMGQPTKSEPSLSHVWLLVKMPDQTYMWLQSFIGHYSLQMWMKEQTRKGEEYLTHEQLLKKLDQFEELRAAATTEWTSRANELYKSLFFVDIVKAQNGQIVNGGYSSETQMTSLATTLVCDFPGFERVPPKAQEP